MSLGNLWDMSTRIPPSLKWLINKRARLLGEITKAEKALTESIEFQERNLQTLRSNLESVDNTIRLHEIPVDPNLIKPIRAPVNARQFAHGELTNLVLSHISKAHPFPLSTTDVAIKIAHDRGIALHGDEFSTLRTSVRHRLKQMCTDGWASRTHPTKTHEEGNWQLGPKAVLYFKQVSN